MLVNKLHTHPAPTPDSAAGPSHNPKKMPDRKEGNFRLYKILIQHWQIHKSKKKKKKKRRQERERKKRGENCLTKYYGLKCESFQYTIRKRKRGTTSASVCVLRGGITLCSNRHSHEADGPPKPVSLQNTLEAALNPRPHWGSHVQGMAFLTESFSSFFKWGFTRQPLSRWHREQVCFTLRGRGLCVYFRDSWLKGPFLSTSSPLTPKPRAGPSCNFEKLGVWGRGRGWLLASSEIPWGSGLAVSAWGAQWWKATHRELFRDY